MNELGRRLAKGDEDAFTQIVERFSRQVFAVCFRILRDTEEAKDMVQEVFTRVYVKRKSFKGHSSVYTWIYRIAVNLCLSQIKRTRVQTVPLDDVAYRLASRTSLPDTKSQMLKDVIAKLIEALPPKQRAVFILRFYERLSFKEIAEVTGTSIGAAKANYHFAVEHLRRLAQGGEDFEV